MREKFAGHTFVNGVVGAAVTLALLPVPAVHFVAPLIGGMAAGSLQDRGVRGGVKVALLSTVFFVVPLAAFFFGVPPSAPTESPIGSDPANVYLLVGGASVWMLALSLAGGYMSGDDESSGEADAPEAAGAD